jgi:hypothetical protein
VVFSTAEDTEHDRGKTTNPKDLGVANINRSVAWADGEVREMSDQLSRDAT